MLGIGGTTALAGCLGDGDSEGDGEGTPESTPESTATDDPFTGDTPTPTPEDDETPEEDTPTPTPEEPEFPEVSGTYDTVTSASFSTLNTLYNTEAGAGTAIGRTIDGAYTFDGNNEVFGLHYKDISTDDGGNVWTIQIRDNLQFSEPYGQVTAEDYVYMIQELHQSEWANTAASTNWGPDTNVEKTGDYEFQVELPTANLLYAQTYDPSLTPVPKGLVQPFVEEEDAEGLRQNEELLELQFTGNLGPFVLDNWERGAGTNYTRNENYYLQAIEEGPDLFNQAPYFEGASISVVEEQASRIGALQSGEADAASIPPERFQEFENDPNVSMYKIPQPFNTIISANQRSNGWQAGPGNLFRYKEMRQAAASAISKQGLIDSIYRGLAKPHYTWQPEFSRWYPSDRDSEIPKFGSNDMYGPEVAQEKAMAAFERAGLDYTFSDGTMLNPSGDQVQLDLYYSSGQETSQLTADFISQEFSQNLGIDVTPEAIDGTRFDSQYWTVSPEGGSDTWLGEEYEWESPNQWNPGPRSVGQNENWDMSIVYGLNTYPRNPLTADVFFDGPTTFYNPVGYYPEFDAQTLWENARNASSVEELKSTFAELFIKLAEDQPYIMMTFEDSLTGYNPDLVGPFEGFNSGWDFPAWYFDDS
jgi:peptide/nickel transport system substrate-binding protein